MPLVACEVVVPTVSGRSRAPWPAHKIPDWENAVAYLFGGISPVAFGVTGKWRDPSAPVNQGIVPDPQNRYEIALLSSRVEKLRQFVLFSCIHFEQECMYFKVGVKVDFLYNPQGWP